MRDLPGGKYTFGSTNRSVTMEEVLIFITPTILPTRTVNDGELEVLPPSPPILNGAERPAAKAVDKSAAPKVLPAPKQAKKAKTVKNAKTVNKAKAKKPVAPKKSAVTEKSEKAK